MKRAIYIFLKLISICSRVFKNRILYMHLIKKTHEVNGVQFIGKPRFIHQNVVLDATAELILGDNIVISRGVLCLTHDYSYTKGLISINERPKTDIALIKPILIGNDVFIGANSTILPGSTIGSNVIVGAGSVVRGNIPDFSIVSGNPASVVNDIRRWAEHKKQNLRLEDILVDNK